MDFLPPYLVPPLLLALLALALLGFSAWLAWPWTANARRRARIERTIEGFEAKGATVLRDLILPDRKGESIWIDFILLTRQGIHLVFVMPCAGRVHGSLRDAMWVQEAAGATHRFPNPLRQSQRAAEAIAHILGSRFPVQEVIVFAGGRLEGSMPANVVPIQRLQQHLLDFEGKPLSGEKRNWIAGSLRRIAIEDDTLKRRHEEDIMLRQGGEQRLRRARNMLIGSGLTMLAAVAWAIASR